jgi:hypothetical protein
LFFGGSEPPQLPTGTTTNLIKNGDFNVDLSGWNLVKGAAAGYAEHTRDDLNRQCVYVDEPNLPNSFDIYLSQTGLSLKKGFAYTLAFEAASSNKTKAEFQVKVGGSSGAYTPYFTEKVSLPVNDPATTTSIFNFVMTNETDNTAQLEFQVAGNPEASYFCFDNVVLSEAGKSEAGNIIGENPGFVAASTDPSSADFSLKQDSPAVDAQVVSGAAVDIQKTRRPKGAASDLGAYESF